MYLLLTAYGMEENLPAYCLSLEEAGEGPLAQKQLRVLGPAYGDLGPDALHPGEKAHFPPAVFSAAARGDCRGGCV